MVNNHTPTTEIQAVPAGFDFTNPEVLEYGVPIDEFARLRATAPVWWNHEPIGTFKIPPRTGGSVFTTQERVAMHATTRL